MQDLSMVEIAGLDTKNHSMENCLKQNVFQKNASLNMEDTVQVEAWQTLSIRLESKPSILMSS